MTRSLRSPYRAAWLAALALAGCAVGPDFKPEVPASPPSFADWHGGSPALIPPQARTDTAAPAGWTMFGDPVLDALEAHALTANADLQGAALRFLQSRAQRSIVESQQAPQLNASAGLTRLRQSENGETRRLLDAFDPPNQEQLIQVLSEPHNFYQAGFDASWELDLWGRVRRATSACTLSCTWASRACEAPTLASADSTARRTRPQRSSSHEASKPAW